MYKLPKFKNESLFIQALTHRSYVNEYPEAGEHNERLEFLGDALLGYLVGEILYKRYKDFSEAQLTRLRSGLVDQNQLAKFAEQLGIGKLMRLGKGAEQEKGRQNPSLLCDTFEAIIGAYYLDSTITPVRAFVKKLFIPVADSMLYPQSDANPKNLVDSKNRFQEWVQANGDTTPPKYATVQEGGTPHKPEFLAKVYVAEKLYGEGKGKSKKDAEKNAAEDALAKLKKPGLL
ncbi:ribonuclease III [Microcoleus sp. herbarium7]|uniref:ribonuclease III n=1 Tax=Microcoleus sp. herbarium7 TaxID=3055435 RepID=UPI002FCF6947